MEGFGLLILIVAGVVAGLGFLQEGQAAPAIGYFVIAPICLIVLVKDLKKWKDGY